MDPSTLNSMDDWGICIDHLHGASLHLGYGGGYPNLYGKRAVLFTQESS